MRLLQIICNQGLVRSFEIEHMLPTQDYPEQSYGVRGGASGGCCVSEALPMAVSEVRPGGHCCSSCFQPATGLCISDAHTRSALYLALHRLPGHTI